MPHAIYVYIDLKYNDNKTFNKRHASDVFASIQQRIHPMEYCLST